VPRQLKRTDVAAGAADGLGESGETGLRKAETWVASKMTENFFRARKEFSDRQGIQE
jgi:hypothetical protein